MKHVAIPLVVFIPVSAETIAAFEAKDDLPDLFQGLETQALDALSGIGEGNALPFLAEDFETAVYEQAEGHGLPAMMADACPRIKRGTPAPEEARPGLLAAARQALAVLEAEAEQRGDNDAGYPHPAGPAAGALRDALDGGPVSPEDVILANLYDRVSELLEDPARSEQDFRDSVASLLVNLWPRLAGVKAAPVSPYAGLPDHMCPAPVPQESGHPAHGGAWAPQG